MEESQDALLYLFLAIVALCVITLLPWHPRRRGSPALYLPLVPFAAYVFYETLMLTRFPQVNIRVDLLVLWPLLIAVATKGWRRWPRVQRPVSEGQVAGLAIASLAAGVVGVALSSSIMFSVIALVAGHRALRRFKADSQLTGRWMALVGLGLGYLGLLLGLALPFVSLAAR